MTAQPSNHFVRSTLCQREINSITKRDNVLALILREKKEDAKMGVLKR